MESSLNISIGANNPGDFPFDLCYVGEGNDVCIEDVGNLVQEGAQPCSSCPGGYTPELIYSSATITDLTAGVSFDIWSGTNPNTGCLWFGYEPAGYAKKVVCDMPEREAVRLNEPQRYANPIIDGAQSTLNKVSDWAEEHPGAVLIGVGIAAVAFGPGVVFYLSFA